MIKILMVCLGNICRSPLAEGILKSKVDNALVFVDSAGTSAFHSGELPDKRSITTAQRYGIDITNQRSRVFKVADFDLFDVIYVMDKSNYQNVVNVARNENDVAKVKLILKENPTAVLHEVPDPYYDTESGFENVYKMLDETCNVIATKLNHG